MKNKKQIKSQVGLCLLAMIFFIGCGARTADNSEYFTEKNTEQGTLSTCLNDEAKYYQKETMEIELTELSTTYHALSTSFQLEKDSWFFYDNPSSSLLLCPFAETASFKPMITFEEYALIAYRLQRDETKDTIITCLLLDYSQTFFLMAYNEKGEVLWKTQIQEDVSKVMMEHIVSQLVIDGQGRIYGLASDRLFLFDQQGNYQGEIPCPEQSYYGIVISDEEAYVTYYEKKGQGQFYIAKANFVKKALTEERKILGNGNLYQGNHEVIFTMDDSFLYRCDLTKGVVEKLLELQEYHLLGGNIRDIAQNENGDILLLYGDLMGRNAMELITLHEIDKEDYRQDEREIITIVGLDNQMSNLTYMIDYFNSQSAEYKVVFEGIAFDEDFYEKFNTRLMAKDSPDILAFIGYEDVERYQSKDFLQDLAPYIEKSEKLNVKDFIDEVLDCYKIGEKIYGFPAVFSIETLVGRTTEIGKEPGWTVEEYFTWLREYPNATAQFGISKERVLNDCLMGSMESYVDWENKKAELDAENFKKLLSNINALELQEKMHLDDWDEVLLQGTPVLGTNSMNTFHNIRTYQEQLLGEVTLKGYPTVDGSPRYYFSASSSGGYGILSRSDNKEAAYKFLEMLVTENFELKNIEPLYVGKRFDGYFSAKKDIFEDNAQLALERTVSEEALLTEEQLETYRRVLKNARKDTYHDIVIRDIIIEEAGVYFSNKKGLEETCQIIQNRVQLYLNEQ